MTSPRIPKILLQRTKAESACQPVRVPPAIMLTSSARHSLLSAWSKRKGLSVVDHKTVKTYFWLEKLN